MVERQYHMHDGRRGAALAIRVIPRAKENEVFKILDDGTIGIQLVSSSDHNQINKALIKFLSQILGVSCTKIEIVAGQDGRDKLVSVISMTAEAVHQKIMEYIF